MKIEIELDDPIYERLKEIFSPDADVGVFASEILKQIVLTYAANPEEFIRAYSEEGSIEARVRMEKSGTASILRRMKRKKEE